MSDDLNERLKKHRLVTLTILFDNAQTWEDFAQFGELVQIDDICN